MGGGKESYLVTLRAFDCARFPWQSEAPVQVIQAMGFDGFSRGTAAQHTLLFSSAFHLSCGISPLKLVFSN